MHSVFVSDSCPAGFYRPTDTASCQQVPPGYYTSGSALDTNLYACPSGTYSLGLLATSCTPCPTSYDSENGASACVGPCLPGSYLSNNECTPAPAGEH